MKIVLLNDDYPPLGRSSVSAIVVGLEKEFRKQGHDVHVITSHRIQETDQIQRRGNVTSLPVTYRISLRHHLSLKNPAVSRMLEKELERIRPDVVHAHNIHTYLTYDALRVARKFTPKVFITMHDVMSFAYGRLKTRRFLDSQGKNTAVTLRENLRTAGLQYNPLRNWRIRRTLQASATKVFAVSDALKHALNQHGIGNVTVVHNGIDLAQWKVSKQDRDAFRKLYGLTDKKVILFGGRLSSDKGVYPLIDALKIIREHVPNAFLLVIGDADKWRGLLEAANVDEDILSRSKCLGWVEREDLPKAYAAADLVTVPSLCLDCLPTMALEASASAKPVVGTIFGGTPEIVKNGETGLILDPRQIDRYATALSSLLKDDEYAHEMGQAGRKRIEQFFTVEKQAQEYLQHYAQDDTAYLLSSKKNRKHLEKSLREAKNGQTIRM